MGRFFGEVIWCLVIVALAIAALVMAADIGGGYSGSILTPATFPELIAWAIILLTLINLAGLGNKIRQLDAGEESAVAGFPWPAIGLGLLLVLELTGYALLLEPLGYILSTSVFMVVVIATLTLLTAPQPLATLLLPAARLVAFSVLFASAVFYLFSMGFELVLPTL